MRIIQIFPLAASLFQCQPVSLSARVKQRSPFCYQRRRLDSSHDPSFDHSSPPNNRHLMNGPLGRNFKNEDINLSTLLGFYFLRCRELLMDGRSSAINLETKGNKF
ncbi:hypothetical protein AVEN_195194-1 [Araneus ventricosus]|uniref:Uncharacterized protein n=1 Tax=Araneus ventricosus TaxID=182803 RepID=A0A4Y2P1I8_ARAVE|nr:hypothetical protein AVEN_195194-1 [Araneus ventricosus]